MSARRAWVLGALATAMAASVGCNKGFAPPSRVDGPRILAVVADPPSGPVGTHVHLRAALAGFASAPSVRWWWCTPGAGTEFSSGSVGPSSDCLQGGESSVQVGSSSEAEFDVPADYLARVAAALAGVDAGRADDAGLPERVPLVLVVSADDGSGPARAVKRFGVALDGATGSNPAPPVLRVRSNGAQLVLHGNADGQCTTDDGATLRVSPGTEVSVQLEGSAVGCWLYADDGEVREGGGCAGFVWQAPDAAGTVKQWFVLGDGQGGSAFCGWEVAVAGGNHPSG